MLTLLLILLSWTAQTTLDVQQISDVQPSPDGSQTLLLTTQSHLEGDTVAFQYRIYLPDADYTVETIADSAPRWSPDGQWIAYRSENTLDLLHIPSKTHQTLATAPITHFSWAPDSSRLAYSTETALHLITLAGTDQILLADIDTVHEIAWAPDGKEITCSHSPSAGFEDMALRCHLTILDLITGQTTPLNLPGSQICPFYSPDGEWIAFVQSEVPTSYNMDRHVAVYSRITHEVIPFLPVENWAPLTIRHTIIGWTPDSQQIICCEPYKTQFRLIAASLDADTWTHFSTINAEVPTLSPSAAHIGFTSQSPNTPPEAYITPTTHFEPIQITHLNDHLPPVPSTKIIHWTAPDGLEIEGLLTLPAGEPPYPLILSIHGGPMFFWRETYTGSPYPHPTAPLAQIGYAVLRPNIRGSCGYGRAFRIANTDDWGGADFQDALAGIDHLISQGIADPNRLAIAGWSYGGYFTAYAIAQTDRFKAASAGAGVFNIPTLALATDIPQFIPDCLPTTYRSPITYASQIKTPLLIQHGTADLRVPYSQALEFTAALDDKIYQFTTYEGMTHTDKAESFRVMQENLDWLKTHLSPLPN